MKVFTQHIADEKRCRIIHELVVLERAIFEDSDPRPEQFKGLTALWIVEDDRVAAYATVDESEDTVHIDSVGTHPHFRGRGFAKTLVKVVVDRYPERDITLSVAHKTKNANHDRLVLFYHKLGFAVLPYKTVAGSTKMINEWRTRPLNMRKKNGEEEEEEEEEEAQAMCIIV